MYAYVTILVTNDKTLVIKGKTLVTKRKTLVTKEETLIPKRIKRLGKAQMLPAAAGAKIEGQ